MSTVTNVVKRGRGRPKGSLNKKPKLAKTVVETTPVLTKTQTVNKRSDIADVMASEINRGNVKRATPRLQDEPRFDQDDTSDLK